MKRVFALVARFRCVGRDRYGPPASPEGAPRLQGASIMAWPALGAACRIGSTPLTSWIAVPASEAVPSVERMTTASPLCRSASDVAGARLINRCKSRSEHHGLAGIGCGLQNRFDAADQLDRGACFRGRALRRENDHRIALMQVSQ